MRDADPGYRDPESGARLPAGVNRDVGSGDRQRSQGWRLRQKAGMADGGRAGDTAPTTARRRWPAWTTSFASSLDATRSYAGWGEDWEIAQNAKPGPKAVRADLLHEAGAHAVQELGYGIAAGVERLVELTAIPAGGHRGAADRDLSSRSGRPISSKSPSCARRGFCGRRR